MQRKPSCFVSYSYEDIDRATLEYFAFLIREKSDDAYEILLDTELPYGNDFQEFMNRLNSEVNAVILMLTPSYKRKILERQGGVYEEYKRIMNRYHQVQEEKRNGKKSGEIEGYFTLFPVLFSGTYETSMPPDISSIKTLEMTGLRVTRDTSGDFQIPAYIARKYIPEILKIVSSLQVITALKSRSFDKLYSEYFKRLFLELKADWDNPRDIHHQYRESLFVKTFAYNKVDSQAVYFLIGRKGSGKTTITDAMAQRNRKRYLGHVPIIADQFNLEIPYYLFDSERIRADTRSTFPREKCFMFAWEAFLFLCCVKVLVEAAKDRQLTDYQIEFVEPLKEFLRRVQGKDAGSGMQIVPLFIYCFSSLTRYLEECITNARDEEEFFFSDLQSAFRRDRFLHFVLPENVVESLLTIFSTLRRKFLVTLDGFDSAFDLFRRQSLYVKKDLEKKAQFEHDWLRSFLQLVLRIKQGGRRGGSLADRMEFCVTVPQDRFFEVVESERDSYQYHNRFSELKWSGIELAILLRKRLEELLQVSTDKNSRPEERLEHLMRAHFRHVPFNIEFDFNGHHYSMPLFMYVLRHTFWRPRDALLYYAQIIAVAESIRKKGDRLSAAVIRHTIKDVTKSVIKSEFINEFESTVVNIKEIVVAFQGATQLLTCDEIGLRVEEIDFGFATGQKSGVDLEAKIDFLYRIGFLGVVADESLRNRLNLKRSTRLLF